MAAIHCTEEDRRIIAEALRAALEGPFFGDDDFKIIFDVDRAEVARVAQAWPRVDENDDRVYRAVAGALTNLWAYPIQQAEDWDRFLSVPRSRLVETLDRWQLPRWEGDLFWPAATEEVRWSRAGAILSRDPDAKVVCPRNRDADLVVEDQLLSYTFGYRRAPLPVPRVWRIQLGLHPRWQTLGRLFSAALGFA